MRIAFVIRLQMSDLRKMNMVDLNVQVFLQCHHCIIGIGALFGKRVLMQQGPP